MVYHYDSRQIGKGDVFICLPGGEPFINDARDNGAEKVMKMTRAQMAAFAVSHFQDPSRKLQVVGVTGTNGKTTVVHLVSHVLKLSGIKVETLGTLNSDLTTPESWDIQQKMAGHIQNKGTHFVMEVSSHGIHQERVLGVDFDVKLLTNLGQDHLDYHQSMAQYHATKKSFMKEGPGLSIYPKTFEKEVLNFPPPLVGTFNYLNLQAAVSILKQLQIDEKDISETLSQVKSPPGRFESICEGQDQMVIVDYAHTPCGLKNVLKTAREMASERQGRLITVFGCGGDRDRSKRPLMAHAVSEYSHVAIVTQDNPRSENPQQIINDTVKGFSGTDTYFVENDREKAIQVALVQSQKKDVVVIAGKGHEDYQIFKDKTIYFDDRETAKKIIRSLIV
ncbi:MAG: UDP-N-acetylmuramoyl-L-alanyl-D-glutamate--2,6-diaminopimelate ligase [Candidatus Margulisbacteria bacterium]|nr:UDP-N-acetylmuramoyl-L-alanyl-D-glutamate--2,6-diaminopimelate ligase [Candidatus Margulisiibacteriota bacterium]